MNATFKCAIAIALFSATAAASAYGGFDLYSDPTLPTVARYSGARSGAAPSAKSGSPLTAQAAPEAVLHSHALPTSVRHHGAPIARNDVHVRELN